MGLVRGSDTEVKRLEKRNVKFVLKTNSSRTRVMAHMYRAHAILAKDQNLVHRTHVKELTEHCNCSTSISIISSCYMDLSHMQKPPPRNAHISS